MGVSGSADIWCTWWIFFSKIKISEEFQILKLILCISESNQFMD